MPDRCAPLGLALALHDQRLPPRGLGTRALRVMPTREVHHLGCGQPVLDKLSMKTGQK